MSKQKEKRQAFKRLAEHRTERAMHYIDLIGNLSNKRAYEFDESDVNKIISALRGSINLMKSKFDGGSSKAKFRLDESEL